MLSFFTKKKTPDTPTEEAIQGPNAPTNNADDFIFVERKEPPQPAPPQQDRPLYPAMPQYPGVPYPPHHGGATALPQHTSAPLPYVAGVPFQLAPELSPIATYEITQSQVDGILAAMTRQTSIDNLEDYNFKLERSIQNESY